MSNKGLYYFHQQTDNQLIIFGKSFPIKTFIKTAGFRWNPAQKNWTAPFSESLLAFCKQNCESCKEPEPTLTQTTTASNPDTGTLIAEGLALLQRDITNLYAAVLVKHKNELDEEFMQLVDIFEKITKKIDSLNP